MVFRDEISPRFVALLVAKNGTSNSMLVEFGLTPQRGKIADRGSHLIDQFCKLRRSEIMLGSKLNACGLMSLGQRNPEWLYRRYLEFGKQERHDTTKGDRVRIDALEERETQDPEFNL